MPLSGLDWLQWYKPHQVYHPGVDFNWGRGNEDAGLPIVSVKDGTVEFVNNSEAHGRGLGLYIIIKHSDGVYSRYAHLSKVDVKVGQKIREGDYIGRLGKTGPTEYAHLHFELFGEAMAEIQRNHTYKWSFYPVGKSKAWVEKHYINPWEYLKAPEMPEWAKIAATKAKKKGIITDLSNPYAEFGNERLEWSLEKAGLLDPSKHEGKVTLARWLVVLDKLGLLD